MPPSKYIRELERVGKSLRALRVAAGLTQAELAEKAGISTSAIQHIELSMHWPNLLILLKIATVLGVEASELLSGHPQDRAAVEQGLRTVLDALSYDMDKSRLVRKTS